MTAAGLTSFRPNIAGCFPMFRRATRFFRERLRKIFALSIEEAADYTGIGRNTLRKLVEWKKLPVLKVGRKVLIKTDILEKFMEANEGRDLRDKGNVKAVTRNVAT